MFCEILRLSFVSMLKKKMPIKLDPDLPTVSSNNKSEVPAKKIRLLGSFAYKASFKKV